MADFTGMTVSVTMRDPPGLILEGKVRSLVPGQTLMLQNVFFPHNGSRVETYLVQSPKIQDLRVIEPRRGTPATTPAAVGRTLSQNANVPMLDSARVVQPPPPAPSITPSAPPTQRHTSSFVDPAILSYDKPPSQARTPSQPPQPSTPVKSILAKAAESLPNNSSPFIGEAGKSNGSRPKESSHHSPAPVQHTQEPMHEVDGTQEVAKAKKKARRSLKKKPSNPAAQDPPPVMNVEVSRNGNDMNGNVKRGKGWRQTPLLQLSPQTGSPNRHPQPTRRQRGRDFEDQQSGWATEDASEIQDLGDFDFEANHKLFDKKQVFDELKQGDNTADEDRLVGHNKVHRPGTHGGKNLHPSENVLSPTLGPKPHSHEGDSSSDADTEANFGGGRSSSRHSASRVSMKRQPSRHNSAQVESRPHPLTASFTSERGIARSVTSLTGRNGRTAHSITTSPLPDRTQSPHSAISTTRTQAASLPISHISDPHLIIRSSLAPCAVLLPSALETLEEATVARFGLTQEAITESAARCIAETAMGMIGSASNSRRGSRANTLRTNTMTNTNAETNAPPVVVILAGNHTNGARAVAAARHLICRRTQIIVVEAQYESSDTQDVQMKTQLSMLKRLVKSGANIKRGAWKRAYNSIKSLSGPPTIIIDALLSGLPFDSLADSSNITHAEAAQQETREMIDWANRSRACVLSVGCPSGVSGIDGSAPVVEGEPLAVRPDKVLALGAPVQGLLEGMKGGEKWDLQLADVGINITLRSEEAVLFGSSWVVDVKFAGEDAVGGEAAA